MGIEKLSRQLAAVESGAVPAGIHHAELIEVSVRKRKTGDGYRLHLLSRLSGGGVCRETRQLARSGDDALVLTNSQKAGLRDFASRFNIDASEPAEIVRELQEAVGSEVSVTVKHTPHSKSCRHEAPQGVRLSSSAGTLTLVGEVLDPENAHTSHTKLLVALTGTRLALTAVCEACYEVRRDRSYASLGYSTLEEYLASPEISMGRSEFFLSAKIHEQFILEHGIEPARLAVASPGKLDIVLPKVSSGEVEVEKALDDVEALGIKDLRAIYRGTEENDVRNSGHCSRCEGIPDEVLDEMRGRFAE